MYRKMILANKIKTVPIVASINKPAAHKLPIAALHHKVAAVFNPLMFVPSFKIIPAPKKPIPETTYAAILVISCALV